MKQRGRYLHLVGSVLRINRYRGAVLLLLALGAALVPGAALGSGSPQTDNRYNRQSLGDYRRATLSRRSAFIVVVLACVMSLAVSLQVSGAPDKQSAKSFVLKGDELAGLHITPFMPYKSIFRYLSGIESPLVTSFPDGYCQLTARKIGLKVGFSALTSTGVGTPESCEFSFAIATGRRWHTTDGLRVGASVHAMRRLYPRALRVGKVPGRHWGIPSHSVAWWLNGRTGSIAHTILEAYARGSRVMAIGIEVVGH
jgi:hypothetical protein